MTNDGRQGTARQQAPETLAEAAERAVARGFAEAGRSLTDPAPGTQAAREAGRWLGEAVRYVREHPSSMLGAAAAGYLVGRILRRR